MPGKTEFILGPSSLHMEPMPAAPPPSVGKGRRGITLHPTQPTLPGGKVNIKLAPATATETVAPLNVYAFFVHPVSAVPTGDKLKPEWFFNESKAPNASIGGHMADAATGEATITVPGVQPSLQPHHMQTILEFPVA